MNFLSWTVLCFIYDDISQMCQNGLTIDLYEWALCCDDSIAAVCIFYLGFYVSKSIWLQVLMKTSRRIRLLLPSKSVIAYLLSTKLSTVQLLTYPKNQRLLLSSLQANVCMGGIFCLQLKTSCCFRVALSVVFPNFHEIFYSVVCENWSSTSFYECLSGVERRNSANLKTFLYSVHRNHRFHLCDKKAEMGALSRRYLYFKLNLP